MSFGFGGFGGTGDLISLSVLGESVFAIRFNAALV
jgi:hypothetical protein